jgi:SPP1 family predicted phage head-tail adaptor
MPRAAKYRHRLVIQQPSQIGQDAYGAPNRSFSTLATVWGQIEPLTGAETDFGDQIVAQSTHRLTIRYRDDVTSQMQATHRGDTYRFTAVLNPGERDVELVIAARKMEPAT